MNKQLIANHSSDDFSECSIDVPKSKARSPPMRIKRACYTQINYLYLWIGSNRFNRCPMGKQIGIIFMGIIQ